MGLLDPDTLAPKDVEALAETVARCALNPSSPLRRQLALTPCNGLELLFSLVKTLHLYSQRSVPIKGWWAVKQGGRTSRLVLSSTKNWFFRNSRLPMAGDAMQSGGAFSCTQLCRRVVCPPVVTHTYGYATNV